MNGINEHGEGEILQSLIEKNLVNHFVKKGINHFTLVHPEKIISYLEEKQKEIEYTYMTILEMTHLPNKKIVKQSEISGKSVVWMKE